MSARCALVTGGAGFIGSHLVESLVEDGWRVRVLDDFSSGRESNLSPFGDRVELLRGDVCDAEASRKAVAGVEVVFHQAAVASVARSVSEPLTTHAVNVLGTLGVLEASRRARVRRVVYASSTSIYGAAPEVPKVEDMPADPRSPYALQKHTGEIYCRLFRELHGLETVALRYFNVYGPRQDPNSDDAAVIPRFVRACLEGETPTIYGDGEQTRDFVYVGDVVRANRLAADAELADFAVCNVASGRPVSLLNLLAEIGRQTWCEPTPDHAPPRAGDVRHSHASLASIRRMLGYAPSVSLEEGLRLTITHFEKEARNP